MSQQIFDLIKSCSGNFTVPVEKLGMDENFMDASVLVDDRLVNEDSSDQMKGHVFGNSSRNCTSSTSDLCPCHRRLLIGSVIAQEIRDKLFKDLGITSSCGIAHNKLLAKLGGSKNKPNAQTIVFHEKRLELMQSLKNLRQIPGLGSATYESLAKKGLTSIQDLQSASLSSLGDIPDAQRLVNLAFGIDDQAVKLSGKPLSIGLEDRFKCISTKAECLEKVKWLLGRLSKLVLEDGRKPQTLKVFIRDYEKDKNDPTRKFCKYSRQGKVNQSQFKNESTILDIAPTCLNLMSKMVDFEKHFHLTLIGISVTDFNSEEVKKGGIERFLGNIASCSKRSLPLSTDDQSTSKRVKSEIDIEKNIKVDSEIPTGWDPDVFNELPKDIQQELVSQKNLKTKEESVENAKSISKQSDKNNDLTIPKGWDQDVFNDLPEDLKKELLEQQNSKAKIVTKPVNSNSKPNTILKYFGKK